MCDYKCKYNIQLRKHLRAMHVMDQKYNCKECEYKTDYVANTWKHTLNQHPDKPLEFTREKNENDFVLKLVAEQNAEILEGMDTMKNYFREAFDNMAEVVGGMKDDTDDKFRTLADTVIKLHSKIAKLEGSKQTANMKDKPRQEKKRKERKTKPTIQPNSAPKPAESLQSAPPSTAAPRVPAAPRPTSQTTPTSSSTKYRSSNTQFMQQPKVLYVGDSVGHTANLRIVEKSLKLRIKSAKAYSSTKDDAAKWPTKNFNDVVSHNLKNPGNEEFNILVMSAPTVDITNIDTINQVKKDVELKVINSCKNMMNIAQRAITQNKSLTKVIVMEHPPRFDGKHKSELTKLANSTLGQLWVLSPLKGRIVIGRHSLESPGVGPTHLARYKDHNTGRYDAVHFYGRSGVRDYTDSIKSIMMIAFSDKEAAQSSARTQTVDDHLREEQAQYEWSQGQSKHTNRQGQSNTEHRYGKQAQPSQPIPTQNRFQHFNQGN